MSTRDRHALRKLRRYSGRLNRMIEDGSFDSLPARKRHKLLSTVRSLHDGLLGVVGEATLRQILAAAAVVVLGIAGCAQSTSPYTDTGTDTMADTGFDTASDTVPDPGWDPDADPGFDPDADPDTDTSTDPGVDTITDPGPDPVTDPTTDPGSGIRFDTVRSNPFAFSGPSTDITMPALADMDGDGDIDLFIGTYNYTSGSDLYYYRNTGSATSAAFASGESNPFGIVTSGYVNAPALTDLDGDGDVDLLVVSIDYGASTFRYYQNTGSSTAPAFASPVSDPFGLVAPTYSIAPITFVDIDDDGDMDLFSNIDWYGRLGYYQNTGSSTAPAFASPMYNPFSITASGYVNAPAFADLDEDGDPDLLMGKIAFGGGEFNYFQNTGTATAATFTAPLRNPFGLTVVGGWYMFTAFADMDNDGDQDLFVGSDSSTLYYFKNITP